MRLLLQRCAHFLRLFTEYHELGSKINAGYSMVTILPGLQWNTGNAYSSNKQKILYGALCFMVKISQDSVDIFFLCIGAATKLILLQMQNAISMIFISI